MKNEFGSSSACFEFSGSREPLVKRPLIFYGGVKNFNSFASILRKQERSSNCPTFAIINIQINIKEYKMILFMYTQYKIKISSNIHDIFYDCLHKDS